MKEIKGYFERTGSFESYVGEILYFNGNLLIPIFNSQLSNHPILAPKEIIHIDYCFYKFSKVYISKRKVYSVDGLKQFHQTNIINENINQSNMTKFLLETLDYKGLFQFWDWIIEAEDFSLIIDEKICQMQSNPFSYKELSDEFFERDYIDLLRNIQIV